MRIPSAICAAALLCPAPAAAQDVSAANPKSIVQAMQAHGFAVEASRDEDGSPLLTSRTSDSNFEVYFYGCTSGTACESLEFWAGYRLEVPVSAKVMNDWNRDKRFATAFVNGDGNPGIRMDLIAPGAGISRESFALTLDFWRLQVEEFEDLINW